MLPKKQRRAFAEFTRAAYDDEILGPKTTLLLQLATAAAVGCSP
jgi:hypothetical protein